MFVLGEEPVVLVALRRGGEVDAAHALLFFGEAQAQLAARLAHRHHAFLKRKAVSKHQKLNKIWAMGRKMYTDVSPKVVRYVHIYTHRHLTAAITLITPPPPPEITKVKAFA